MKVCHKPSYSIVAIRKVWIIFARNEPLSIFFVISAILKNVCKLSFMMASIALIKEQ